jgi:hypothetical protein
MYGFGRPNETANATSRAAFGTRQDGTRGTLAPDPK